MTRIKVCGLTREEDVEAAVDAGVDFLGFNLWRKSPRALTPGRARELVARVPLHVIPVAVFVHGEAEDLVCAEFTRVAWVQLHATPPDWSAGRIARPVVRALPVTAPLSPGELAGADYWLLDAAQPGHGGGGKRFDWSLAEPLAGHPRVFIAGGLDPGNVGEVVRRLKPYAVDVASGCESAPGVKDPAKIRDFVAAVRGAEKDASGAPR